MSYSSAQVTTQPLATERPAQVAKHRWFSAGARTGSKDGKNVGGPPTLRVRPNLGLIRELFLVWRLPGARALRHFAGIYRQKLTISSKSAFDCGSKGFVWVYKFAILAGRNHFVGSMAPRVGRNNKVTSVGAS